MNDATTNTLPWQHDLDAKKHLTEVHMGEFKKLLGTDFKMAKFDDKEREFIMTILTAGLMAVDICPHPDIAEDIKQMDYAYINALAVLKFNVDGNMIVNRITNWTEHDNETKDKLDFIDRFNDRITGKKKPKMVEENNV